MDRRDLLSNFFRLGVRDNSPQVLEMPVTGGVELHTDPLTLNDVYHLLRRIGFGATVVQAKSYVGKTASEVVDELLGSASETAPESPGTWVDVINEDPEGADLQTRGAIYNQWEINMGKLATWWIDLMRTDPKAVEKLTLFWSGHWTSEFTFDIKYSIPQTLYRQYLMLRSHRIGDMKQMALDVTLDNAMLYYLGGTLNDAGKPNENYGRELQELFLLGIGWYTEGDVKEAARVLTGWKSQRYVEEPAPNGIYNSWFEAAKHDTGAKQYLGQTIPARTPDNNTEYQVKNEEVFELIKIIFRERPEAASRFLATKAYKFFVYSSPLDVDPIFIEDLASAFRNANFDLKVLFKTMLTSKHFFDPAIRGAQIKTPLELVVGLMRQLGQVDSQAYGWGIKMDQTLMDTPDVSGWPGYRSWISTNTYPQRRSFASKLVESMSDSRVNEFIREFDDYTDIVKLTTNIVDYLLPAPVTTERLDYYVQTVIQGAPTYEWPGILGNPTTAAARVRNLLLSISKAPDFQLC
ncbi:MAG: DUF1800 domain-containing protein [Ignavibacteria bacterium]|nr:DUF1800 domain-containing protein [Ignavibacteria bacterium]